MDGGGVIVNANANPDANAQTTPTPQALSDKGCVIWCAAYHGVNESKLVKCADHLMRQLARNV
jgi:hypothetical protein